METLENLEIRDNLEIWEYRENLESLLSLEGLQSLENLKYLETKDSLKNLENLNRSKWKDFREPRKYIKSTITDSRNLRGNGDFRELRRFE